MRSLFLSLASLSLLSACGPDFSGRWTGNINELGSCSDGSAVPSSNTGVTWSLSTKGSTVTIVTTGACGSFSATQQGTMATIGPHDCAAVTDAAAGVTVKKHINGGSMSLMGETLSLTISSRSAVATPNAVGTCDTTATGVLARL